MGKVGAANARENSAEAEASPAPGRDTSKHPRTHRDTVSYHARNQPEELGRGPKRMRQDDEVGQQELEIDVTLSEPLSRKALRRAKKAKVVVDSTAGRDSLDSDAIGSTAQHQHQGDKGTEGERNERRTEHSIWIGNLPWTATKQDIRDFICEFASLEPSQIVRLHVPSPAGSSSKDPKRQFKNKGFAYVDFSSAEALFAALQLTETPFLRSGRNILVKNARSFEGRPEEHLTRQKRAGDMSKPPNKRVYVGNLAFETTKGDLLDHFGQCGEIEDIHMATFEDSGNCKGFAWISFGSLEAAEAAVKGYVVRAVEPKSEGREDKELVKRPPKPRKWFISKLQGRELKREYAEDARSRYNKRFRPGSGSSGVGDSAEPGTGKGPTVVKRPQAPQVSSSRERGIRTRSSGTASGTAASRNRAAIAEPMGSKITFE